MTLTLGNWMLWKKNSSTLSKRLHIDGLSGNHQWAQILTFPNGKKINTDDPANSKLHNDLILYIFFSKKNNFPTFYILHSKQDICTLKFLIRVLRTILILFFYCYLFLPIHGLSGPTRLFIFAPRLLGTPE